jgi:hypothetical protein
MIPKTPPGYATAYANAGIALSSAVAVGIAEIASCPAPREGVFVVAPENKPAAAKGLVPSSGTVRAASPAPPRTMAAAQRFRARPCRCSDAKKPGPICRPIVKTKRINPNSRAKSRTLCSIFQPKWPKNRPAKSTPALPNPMPRTLTAAMAKPAMETMHNTRTACATALVFSRASSQLIAALRDNACSSKRIARCAKRKEYVAHRRHPLSRSSPRVNNQNPLACRVRIFPSKTHTAPGGEFPGGATQHGKRCFGYRPTSLQSDLVTILDEGAACRQIGVQGVLGGRVVDAKMMGQGAQGIRGGYRNGPRGGTKGGGHPTHRV